MVQIQRQQEETARERLEKMNEKERRVHEQIEKKRRDMAKLAAEKKRMKDEQLSVTMQRQEELRQQQLVEYNE